MRWCAGLSGFARTAAAVKTSGVSFAQIYYILFGSPHLKKYYLFLIE